MALESNVCCREHSDRMGGMGKLCEKMIVVGDNLSGGQLAIVASGMTIGYQVHIVVEGGGTAAGGIDTIFCLSASYHQACDPK